MTYSELQALVFDLLGQSNSADNEYLTLTAVKRELTSAHRWLAAKTSMYTRSHTMPAIASQATYVLPVDMVAVTDVMYDGTLLTLTTDTELSLHVNSTWRTASDGTPSLYYRAGNYGIGLYPPPEAGASELLVLYGPVMPHEIGGGITNLARASNVLTVTTTSAHGLRVGEYIAISGVADTSFHETSVIVASVPSTTTFTVAQTDSDDTDTTGDLAYAGGVLPLTADADVPAFLLSAHEALAYRAAITIGTTLLADDPRAQSALPGCQALLATLVTDLQAYSA